jgi:hypothetical protein
VGQGFGGVAVGRGVAVGVPGAVIATPSDRHASW